MPVTLRLRDLTESSIRGPLRLLPNRISRFYRGGAQLDRYLGLAHPLDDNWSEEWLGNATPPAIATSAGEDERGLARALLSDGSSVTVRDLFESFPEAVLGKRHLGRYGTSPAMLLKYLDVASHIPVHCHPSRDVASQWLNSRFGKNEAWLVLGAEQRDDNPARVWIGWRERIDREKLWQWIKEQDIAAMRASMHEVRVHVNDVLFIPAGTVHSLGEGVFAMEPQEPTDFAVFAEYATYDLDEATATNGLGWERALEIFDRSALEPSELESRIRCRPRIVRKHGGGREEQLVSDEATAFFRLGRLLVSDELDDHRDSSYALYAVRRGFGSFAGPWGEMPFRRGETYLIPAALESIDVQNEGREPTEILKVQPPL